MFVLQSFAIISCQSSVLVFPEIKMVIQKSKHGKIDIQRWKQGKVSCDFKLLIIFMSQIIILNSKIILTCIWSSFVNHSWSDIQDQWWVINDDTSAVCYRQWHISGGLPIMTYLCVTDEDTLALGYRWQHVSL